MPRTSLALLSGLAPPPPGVGLVPAAACAHRASARVSPHPAGSCQCFPRLLFLLLRPSPPLRTPSPPSTPRAAATPRALLRLQRAHRSPLAGLLQSVCLSVSLKFPISSRSRQREENTQFCLPFQVRSHTLVPTGTLASPFTFASRAWLISPHSLSDAPWKPKRLRSPPPPQHV